MKGEVIGEGRRSRETGEGRERMKRVRSGKEDKKITR